MRIVFHCSHCQAEVKAEEQQAGRTVRCPKCRRSFELVRPKPLVPERSSEKNSEKEGQTPIPVSKLGNIFIIDNTDSGEMGKVTEVAPNELPFKLPTAKRPAPKIPASKRPGSKRSERQSVKKDDSKRKTASSPAVQSDLTPPDESPVPILDLPKFDLTDLEAAVPEEAESPFFTIEESSEKTPSYKPSETKKSGESASASVESASKEPEGVKKPKEPEKPIPATEKPVTMPEKGVAPIFPVPERPVEQKPVEASPAPSAAPSQPAYMPRPYKSSSTVSLLLTGLVIVGAVAAIMFGGLWLLDHKKPHRGDSMGDFQRSMEQMAADPAGPFLTTTELIDGKMALTHESETFPAQTVEFDDMRIEIQRLLDEGFPEALINRYVGGDANGDGYVDEGELAEMFNYKGDEKF